MIYQMQSNIRLSEELAPHFHATFNSKKSHQADEGGRGSTKTSKNALKVVYHILAEENISAVVMRKHGNKIRRSVFKEILRAFKRLGVPKGDLKYTLAPPEITYKPTGNTIYFTGIESIDDIKGMIDEYNPIKIIWLEELTQFADEEEIANINATFVRGNDDWFITLYSWNAPQDLYHWIYQWVDKMLMRPDFIHTDTTYLTVPRHFLGELFFKEAEMTKLVDEDLYNHVYLNKPVRLKGLVYKKWNENKHVGLTHAEEYDNDFLTCGVDYGETDATSWTLESFPKNFRKQHYLRHYYHKNSVTKVIKGLPFLTLGARGKVGIEKDVNDYTNDFFECMYEWHKEFKCRIEVYVDSANKFFYSTISNRLKTERITWLRVYKVNKIKEDETIKSAIEERIQHFNFQLGAETCKFSNHESMYALKKAISQAKRNDKGERIDDGKANIDSLDGMEYGFKKYMSRIKKAIIMYSKMKR
jgi:PBSX family phage terminase large subunit